ncbi:hypothetical protein ACUN0C_09190 [Faunimonas sp. B44]|uniref:hypothetical protein n=1 Tax=Faunimonas sp. B44 TaxID=3461493 RepID=UPI0040450B4F
MSLLPLAHYLIDFTDLSAAGGVGAPAAGPQAEAVPADRPEGVEERIGEARRAAWTEGYAAAEAEMTRRMALEREAHAAALAAERARWAEEEGEVLRAAFSAGMEQLRAGIEAGLGRALRSVLEEGLRRRAVAAVSEALAVLIEHRGRDLVKVSGPEDLLEAIRRDLGAVGSAVVFEPGQGPDVRVVADQTLIETELAAALLRLDEAVA